MNKTTCSIALQPIVDMATGQVAHYEALFRVSNHDEYGNSHVMLLNVAEAQGWIDQVDLFVLKQALTLVRQSTNRVAVNISPRTLTTAAREILALLKADPDSANRMILEITELVPIEDLPAAVEFTTEARKLGARIALDDFGSDGGHIHAGVVLAICPDFLKLDRVVMENEAEARKVLAQAMLLAAETNAAIIAEFMDSDRKIDFAYLLGIRYAQGAEFGLAVPYAPSVVPVSTGAIAKLVVVHRVTRAKNLLRV